MTENITTKEFMEKLKNGEVDVFTDTFFVTAETSEPKIQCYVELKTLNNDFLGIENKLLNSLSHEEVIGKIKAYEEKQTSEIV